MSYKSGNDYFCHEAMRVNFSTENRKMLVRLDRSRDAVESENSKII
jgi:hypothetical protein